MFDYDELNSKSMDELEKIKKGIQEKIALQEMKRQELIRSILYIQHINDIHDFKK